MAGKKEAFTLVEILVVILIIGLLFVFLVPKISSATDKARETGIKTDMHSYQVAFESVVKECSGLGDKAIPKTKTGTDNDDAAVSLVKAVNGYLDPALEIKGTNGAALAKNTAAFEASKKDPWNNNYVIVPVSTASSNNGNIMVYSKGKTSAGTATIGNTDAEDLGIAVTNGAYALQTSYIDGVQYTATKGFSTEIKAK